MASVNDEKFAALRGAGYTGAMNDMTLQWLQAGGAISNCLPDAWMEWLKPRTVTDGTRNDMWFEFLRTSGYTGALNDMEFAFWSSGAIPNVNPAGLYPNYLLAGGSDIVADVGVMPTSHVSTAFGGVPADATYIGPANPAYTFVGTGNSRFAISMNVNTATNRGVTLQGGRKYRFSAEVQSIGEAAVATRLINAAALTGGAILIDGPLVVPDGTWQSVYVDFGLVNITDTIQLRHGIGMFNAVTTVGATQQTRNLKLVDVGVYP